MEPEEFPGTSAESIPAADIQFEASDQGILMTRTYAVKQPDTDKSDFIVEVRASTLARCRRQLGQIKGHSFPWGDILFGVSTSAVGAIAGALAGNIKLESVLGVVFYILLPIVAVGTFVAYIFHRRTTMQDASEIAQEVLAELPDPDRAV